MTQTLIEKLNKLPTYDVDDEGEMYRDKGGYYVRADDICTIIEEHKRESACQYGKDVGMPEYSCAVKCQYAQPFHAQLIGELVQALDLINPGNDYTGWEGCDGSDIGTIINKTIAKHGRRWLMQNKITSTCRVMTT